MACGRVDGRVVERLGSGDRGGTVLRIARFRYRGDRSASVSGMWADGAQPTWGRVSRHGVFPLSESLDHIGPWRARRPIAPQSWRRSRARTGAIRPRCSRPCLTTSPVSGRHSRTGVGIAQAYAFDRLDDEVLTALTGAKDALVTLGARTVPVDFPSIADATTAWLHLCLSEVAIAHETTYPAAAPNMGPHCAAFWRLQAK